MVDCPKEKCVEMHMVMKLTKIEHEWCEFKCEGCGLTASMPLREVDMDMVLDWKKESKSK